MNIWRYIRNTNAIRKALDVVVPDGFLSSECDCKVKTPAGPQSVDGCPQVYKELWMTTQFPSAQGWEHSLYCAAFIIKLTFILVEEKTLSDRYSRSFLMDVTAVFINQQ